MIKAIKGERVDRLPFIAPAGLVSSVPEDALSALPSSGESFGSDPSLLADLSVALAREAGLESLGLPYLMTVESECYGGETECGPFARLPHPYEYPYISPAQHENLPSLSPSSDGRLPVVLDTLKRLRQNHPDMPVIGDIVAPVSLATSLMDTGTLFKSFIKEPEEARAFLNRLTENSIAFLRAQLDAGADVIFITDPASTVGNLGPELFANFVVPFINRLVEAATNGGALAIVHICGPTEGLNRTLMEGIKAPCLSLDDLSHIELLAGKFSIMGGVDSSYLFKGRPDEFRVISSAAPEGISVLAPSCGVSR